MDFGFISDVRRDRQVNKCTFCDIVFSSKGNLLKHLCAIHIDKMAAFRKVKVSMDPFHDEHKYFQSLEKLTQHGFCTKSGKNLNSLSSEEIFEHLLIYGLTRKTVFQSFQESDEYSCLYCKGKFKKQDIDFHFQEHVNKVVPEEMITIELEEPMPEPEPEPVAQVLDDEIEIEEETEQDQNNCCQICNNEFPSQEMLALHRFKQHKKCPKCKITRFDQRELIDHYYRKHSMTRECFVCHEEGQILEHVNLSHFNTCTFCMMPHDTEVQLNSHLFTQHSIEPLTSLNLQDANEEEIMDALKRALVKVELENKNVYGLVKCSICLFKFDSIVIKDHFKKIHIDKMEKFQNPTSDPLATSNDDDLTCSHCSKEFQTKMDLNLHKAKQHLTCSKCLAKGSSIENVIMHLIDCNFKQLSCLICLEKQDSGDKDKFHMHVRSHFVTCQFCGKNCNIVNLIIKHLLQEHDFDYITNQSMTTLTMEEVIQVFEKRFFRTSNNVDCPVCSVSFPLYGIKGHLYREHIQKMKMMINYQEHQKNVKGQAKPSFPELEDSEGGPTAVNQSPAEIEEKIYEKSQPCRYCHNVIFTEKQMKRHIVKEHLKCPICRHNLMFKSLSSLFAHMITNHQNSKTKTVECLICYASYESPDKLTTHFKQELGITEAEMEDVEKVSEEQKKLRTAKSCKFCDVFFVKWSRLSDHYLNKHTYCHNCQYQFDNESILKYHMTQVHAKSTYVCDNCDFRTLHQTSVNEHQSVCCQGSNQVAKKVCKYCKDVAFNGMLYLSDHYLNNHWFCYLCNAKYPSQDWMKQHMEDVHLKLGVRGPGFVCSKCGYCTLTKNPQKPHDCIGRQEAAKDIRHECKFCKTLHFDSSIKLSNHYLNEHLYCDLCEEEYATQEWICKHIKNEHAKYFYICESCGFRTLHSKSGGYHACTPAQVEKAKETCQFCSNIAFDSLPKLSDHLLNKHLYCDLCHEEYANSDWIKNHMITEHDNQHYICDECGFLSLKGTLHASCIKNVDPLSEAVQELKEQCRHCENVVFEQYAELSDHYINTHYFCDLCKMGQANKEWIARHLKEVHGMTCYLCVNCGFGSAHRFSIGFHACALQPPDTDRRCKFCKDGTRYDTLTKISDHYLNKHMFCHPCNEQYAQKQWIEKHMKEAHPQTCYICIDCGYRSLLLEPNSVYGHACKEKPAKPRETTKVYQCVCGYQTISLKYYNRHRQREHGVQTTNENVEPPKKYPRTEAEIMERLKSLQPVQPEPPDPEVSIVGVVLKGLQPVKPAAENSGVTEVILPD